MIINSQELRDVRADHKDQTIAFRLGCYDILHYGHQNAIDFTADQADIVAIGVMSDEYILGRKGRTTINPIEKRIGAIDNAENVDYSFVMQSVGGLAIMQTLMTLRPDVYVEGEEHGERRARKLLLGAMGIQYVIHRFQKDASSSDIISRFGRDEAARLSSLSLDPKTLPIPTVETETPDSIAA